MRGAERRCPRLPARPPSPGQRAPPGQGGGRRPPRSFSAARPAGQLGAPRGLSPFRAILVVNFKHCLRERRRRGGAARGGEPALSLRNRRRSARTGRAGSGQAGRREPRRRAATCALDARLTGLSRPYLPFPAERWLPGLGSEDVVKEWGCLPRELAMAREDSVRCLRCLLYALNLLFWVSPSKWRLRRASRPRWCPFIRGCGNRGGEAAPWVSLMRTLGQVGLIMRCLKEKRLETCCK